MGSAKLPPGMDPNPPEASDILAAMLKVMAAVGAIGKDHHNKLQSYDYRAVEDYFNTLQPIFLEQSILPVPNLRNLLREERTSSKGTVSVFTIIEVDYEFTHVPTSQVLVVRAAGEGSDTSDKSLNKAYSSAFKNCMTQLLSIPTKDAIDSERDSPELSISIMPETKQHPAPESLTYEEQRDYYNKLVSKFKELAGVEHEVFAAKILSVTQTEADITDTGKVAGNTVKALLKKTGVLIKDGFISGLDSAKYMRVLGWLTA